MQMDLQLAFLFLLNVLIGLSSSSLNPYDILGVKRTDSDKTIKAAYKRKALKLHPDRNKSPDAQSEMMKINEAYEILSDSERRKLYDNYGKTTDDVSYKQHHSSHSFRGPAGTFSFMFEDLPFGSNYHFRNYQQQNLLTRYNYYNIILPDSHHKLFLIYVVGEICFECYQLEYLWEKMSKSLNSIGIGVYKMVYDQDSRLAYDIGVNTYPQFFAVVAGRIVRYKASSYREGEIRSFLSSLLPHYLLDYIILDFVEYFEQSIHDNKPQCLLFSKHLDPPLLFKAVAYEYHKKVKFAYVDVKDLRTKILQRKYDINTTDPVIVLLKEEPSSPVAILRGNALVRGALRKLVASNLYLNVPRLSSQTIFDDLCVKPSSVRMFCLILIVEKNSNFTSSLWKLRQMVTNENIDSKKVQVQFTYMYSNVHEKFLEKFEGNDMHLIPCSDGTLPYKILMLSVSEKKVFFEWFTNGWCGTDESVSELDVFIDDLSAGGAHLRETELAELVDEHYHGILYDFMKKMYHGVQHIVDGADSPSWYNIPSVGIILLVLLVLLTFAIIPTLSYFANKPDNNLPQHMPNTMSTTILGLRKIDHRTQKEFIHEAKPGKITISILVDTVDVADVAESPIIQAFSDVIYQYTFSNENYTFTWLSIAESTNLLWCTEVMNVKEFGAFMPGTVLAMNGFRKYVYIFKPNVEMKEASGISGNFLGMESSDDECDNYKHLERVQYKKAALCIRKDLPTWLERLSEGTLSNKVKIKEWPTMEE